MSEEQTPPQENVSPKRLLQGTVLILISNLIYIGNNYLVAWTKLQAPEIALVRGGFQVILFGAIIYRGRQQKDKEMLAIGIHLSKFFVKNYL